MAVILCDRMVYSVCRYTSLKVQDSGWTLKPQAARGIWSTVLYYGELHPCPVSRVVMLHGSILSHSTFRLYPLQASLTRLSVDQAKNHGAATGSPLLQRQNTTVLPCFTHRKDPA
jgi:hypothetical protein